MSAIARTRIARSLSAAAVLLGLAGLAGCVGPVSQEEPSASVTVEPTEEPTTEPGEEPTEEPTSTEEPTPTEEPTSTEEPEAPVAELPAVADLVLTTSGLGPLTVGLPPSTNPGAAMIAYDPEYCLDESGSWSGEGDPGGWVSTYPVEDDGRPVFWVSASDDAVLWIDAVAPSIRTSAGIIVGSTLVELQAAYPDLQEGTSGIVSRVWWVSDEAGTVVFETQDDTDGLQPAGTPESVVLMRVLAPGIDPDFAAANSGNVAGACF